MTLLACHFTHIVSPMYCIRFSQFESVDQTLRSSAVNGSHLHVCQIAEEIQSRRRD